MRYEISYVPFKKELKMKIFDLLTGIQGVAPYFHRVSDSERITIGVEVPDSCMSSINKLMPAGMTYATTD
ncbi:MAG: hypothetical protein AABX54_02470 [Nanoarchaeota archaeon]